MFTKFNPKAAGMGAFLMALAFVGVTSATAQFAPSTGEGGSATTSTTCGAGTLEKCSEVYQEICDWVVEVGVDPVTKTFTFKLGRTDCKKGGSIPIYKDKDATSLLSGSCDLLAPFLGRPAGTSCSE